MEAIRREEVIVKDGQIHLTGLPYRRGDRVEIIVLPQADKTRTHIRLTVRQLRQSGLIGLWRDRSDIEDSSAYARRLREQAQQRGEVQ
ncbi:MULTISPECIES: hypothetical protein [unclassified Roseiflexus]|jgi:hypothetical protein|uniref:hypothetical protein n=1 Tax=unclassified Roseiflexus TaxID=2609473 RepID=UPI0000D80EF2|nr:MULTISPECIES: hypothetical protein [unclassified Roseiflexus]ABQ91968.1 hypothetical protein RoseRS_3613 [Roseiflexus sp. RS-1]MCL6538986.1 hypothetical protein [Roseiflexus sp.]